MRPEILPSFAGRSALTWFGFGKAGRMMAGLLLLSGLPALPAADAAPAAPDGNALVRKMVAVYQKANTLKADFEARIVQLGGSEYLQSGHLEFKRPLYISLYTTDPLAGSFQAITDPRTITVYGGQTNRYTKRNAPPTLREMLDSLEKSSADVLEGQRSTQLFSPLSFMTASGMPREAQSFTYSGIEAIKGRKTYRVKGKMNENFLKTILGSSKVMPVQRDVTLWIDAQTSLILRTSSTLSWRVPLPVRPGEKQKYGAGGIAFTETYSGQTINTPIADTVFHFVPPQGAEQRFQEGR